MSPIILDLRGELFMAEDGNHPFNEAGRRLKAAMISYQLGLAGVDSTLKKLPKIVDDSWAEMAEKLLRGMAVELETSRKARQGRIQ
jgi:hypothetical protein